MSNSSIVAKPFFYTGKVTGYINVLFKKLKTTGNQPDEEKGFNIALPRPKINPSQKSLEVITLVKTDAKEEDAARGEYYQSFGKELAALLESDQNSENLTIIDLSKWCR